MLAHRRSPLVTLLIGLLVSFFVWTPELIQAVPTAAPTKLTVTQDGPRASTIQWTPIQNFSGSYQIDMTTTKEPARRTIVTTSAFTARFMNTGVTYTISVRGITADGLGPAITTSFTVPPTPVMGPIADLTLVPNATTLQIRWSPVTNALKYDIKTEDIGLSAVNPLIRQAPVVPMWLTGFIPGRTYRITVTAYGDGQTTSVASREIRMDPLRPPGQAPTHVTIQPQDNGGTMSWLPTPNTSAYIVQLATAVQRLGSERNITTTSTSLTLSDLPAHTAYFARILPINPGGSGPVSDTINWITETVLTTKPEISGVTQVPHGLIVTFLPAIGSTQTKLALTRYGDHQGPKDCPAAIETPSIDITQPTGYANQINVTRTGNVTTPQLVSASNPTTAMSTDVPVPLTSPARIDNLLGWQPYALRVFGTIGSVAGPLSDTQIATPIGRPRAIPQVRLSIRPDKAGITVTWPDVPDAKQYTLRWAQGVNVDLTQVTSTYIPQPVQSPYQLNTPIAGQDYTVGIIPSNDAGAGCLSQPVTGKSLALPEAPAVTATSGDHTIELKWESQPSVQANGYHIMATPRDRFEDQPVSATINLFDQTSPVTLTGLTNGQPYDIVVIPSNGVGEGKAAGIAAAAARPLLRTWKQVTSAPITRAGHTAGLLPNGDVLMVGGLAQTSITTIVPLVAVNRYTESPTPWSRDAPLDPGRSGQAMVTLANGHLLTIGGHNGITEIATVQDYNPSILQWTTRRALRHPRAYHTATAFRDGSVLVIGGLANGVPVESVEIYHPDTDTWEELPPLVPARVHHSATLLRDGKVLVVGGMTGDGRVLDEVLLWDPAGWQSATSLNQPRASHSATRLYDGSVLIVGGIGEADLPTGIVQYDPIKQQWGNAGTLAVTRYEHQASLLHDGSVLLTGGTGALGIVAYTERIPYGTSDRAPLPGLPFPVYLHSATVLLTGETLLMGGWTDSDTTNRTVKLQ